MSKKTGYLLGILATIILCILLLWWRCPSCGCNQKKKAIKKTVIIPEAKKAVLTPFGIKEVNESLLLKMGESFSFGKSKYILKDNLPKDVNDGVLKIKEYLDENGQKRFNITGYYSSTEKNTSAYPNLGLARASSVKNYMASKGISTMLIDTYGKLNDELNTTSRDVIYKAIDFGIVDKDAATSSNDQEVLKLACDALKDSPLILYFKTSEASINLTASQREKFSKISNCVDKLGAKIQVIGHTDNTGDPSKNIILGQNRADFGKQYLISNGIPANQIEAISKGQSSPMEENTTSAGRAKNRRTVITIK